MLHKNIIKICNRPYKDLSGMTEDIIKKWNKKVRPEDTVFLLGDIIWGCTKAKSRAFFSRLNGKKVIIWGNHDKDKSYDMDCFEWSDKFQTVTIQEEDGDTTDVVLCHYAMGSWDGSWKGAVQLFGHSHGCFDKSRMLWNQMDVGWDIKLDLFSWEDVKEQLTKQLMEMHKI